MKSLVINIYVLNILQMYAAVDIFIKMQYIYIATLKVVKMFFASGWCE